MPVAVLVPGPERLDLERPFLEMCASTVSLISEFYLSLDLLYPRGLDMFRRPFYWIVVVGLDPNYPRLRFIAPCPVAVDADIVLKISWSYCNLPVKAGVCEFPTN
jgi:hypothetical protein